MKSVNVKYFALFRELAGKDTEAVQSTEQTYADLYLSLAGKYGFKLAPEMVQVAVNDEFTELSEPILDGAKVVFIPPVAGG